MTVLEGSVWQSRRKSFIYLLTVTIVTSTPTTIIFTIITKLMEKSNLNIVVFDQDDSFTATEQSQIAHSTARRQTSDYGLSSSPPQQVISNEIHLLREKIHSLQEKANKIEESLRTTVQNSSSGMSSSSHLPQSSGQLEEVLRVVETKIQIIIQETKKIIEKLTSEFDRKIAQSSSQKTHEHNSIAKIQKHCRDSLQQIEDNYQRQMAVVKDEHKQLEDRLIQRVQELEKTYRNKLKDFESKEASYLSTIEHLENKVRAANRSKKMLEVTQEKPILNVKCDFLDNTSGLNSQSINGLPANDTSMSKRRKIFDSKRSNRSISPNQPNNQVLSPLKPPAERTKQQTQSVAKKPTGTQNNEAPESQYPVQSVKSEISPMYRGSSHQESRQPQSRHHQSRQPESRHQSSRQPSSSYMSSMQPDSRQFQSRQQESRQQEVKYQENRPPNNRDGSRASTSKNQIKDESATEFYRDAPKPQWERFQDYDQNESSGSEEDVFFYPEHVRSNKPEPEEVFKYGEGSDRMFSPFDVK